MAADWGQLHGNVLPPGWSAFDPGDRWPEWRDELGSWPWILEHTHHFFGKVRPICWDGDRYTGCMLFSAGGLYFAFVFEEVPETHLPFYVYPPGSSLTQILDGITQDQWILSRQLEEEAYGALSELEAWATYWMSEMGKGRNRWREMAERGGHPPAHLLLGYFTMPTSDTEKTELEKSMGRRGYDLQPYCK